MARIRSLKPEHKTHRKIGPLSDRQYRVWIGMLTEADDEGRLVADIPQLRMLIFGYHPRVHCDHVEAALQSLATAGLIVLYEVDGTRYAAFPSWRDHQSLDRPRRSNFPPPLHSSNGHRGLDEPSTKHREDSTGIESNRNETNRNETNRAVVEGSTKPDVACATGSNGQKPAHRQPTAEEQLNALAQREGLTRDELKRQADTLAKRAKR